MGGKEPFITYKKANAILIFHNLFGGESFLKIIMTAYIYVVFDSLKIFSNINIFKENIKYLLGLVPNRKRSMSRLYIVTLLI